MTATSVSASSAATASPRAEVRVRPEGGARPAAGWDVASWAFGPRRGYRINTSFRRDEGAVVTVSGCVDSPSAAGELAVALQPFELLGCPVVVDVRHAELSDVAVRVLVDAGLRPAARGFTVTVVHADDTTRHLVTRAGGATLLAQPGTDRSRSEPPVPVGRPMS